MTDIIHTARLMAFIKKSLADGLAPFVNEQATPRVREQIEGIVRGHLERLSQEIAAPAPDVEAYMSSPGTVSFRVFGPIDPRMHAALWEIGLVDKPPAEYVVVKMTVPTGES